MNNFDEFFDKHKNEIIRYAKQRTTYNNRGQATITKSDEWFYDDVWEKELVNKENKDE